MAYSSAESDLKANVNVQASGLKSMYAEAGSDPVGYEDFNLAKELDRDVDAAINLVEESKEEMRKFEEMINVTMMDRGVQDQFLSTHAAVMADNEDQCTASFIVIDGSKPLDEKVTTSKFRLAFRSFIEKPRDVATQEPTSYATASLTSLLPFLLAEDTINFLAKGVSKGH